MPTNKFIRYGALLAAFALLIGLAVVLHSPSPTVTKAPIGASLSFVDTSAESPCASDRNAAESRLDAAERTVTAQLERHAPDLPAERSIAVAECRHTVRRTTERHSQQDGAESG